MLQPDLNIMGIILAFSLLILWVGMGSLVEDYRADDGTSFSAAWSKNSGYDLTFVADSENGIKAYRNESGRYFHYFRNAVGGQPTYPIFPSSTIVNRMPFHVSIDVTIAFKSTINDDFRLNLGIYTTTGDWFGLNFGKGLTPFSSSTFSVGSSLARYDNYATYGLAQAAAAAYGFGKSATIWTLGSSWTMHRVVLDVNLVATGSMGVMSALAQVDDSPIGIDLSSKQSNRIVNFMNYDMYVGLSGYTGSSGTTYEFIIWRLEIL